MAEIVVDCSTEDCWEMEMPPPPDFIRAPPSFLCDAFPGDDYSTCTNEIPFPFHINADGTSQEATLAVALVCAVIFSILLVISGVFLWRNKKHVRKYLTCHNQSPRDTSRKGTPSAASTSDGSSSEGAAYTDNIEYKKKALLAAISPPSGVRFLTDTAIRYAPSQPQHLTLLDTQHHHPQQHIYEEIPNNYSHPRYFPGTTFSQQAFAQRQSWLDLLHRPPCPDMAFNLYDDGTRKIAAACPNCYYPSLPRDSAQAEQAPHIVVNPVDEMSSRRHRRYASAAATAANHYNHGMLDPEHYQTTQALVIRNEFPSLRHHQQLGQRSTRTLEASSQSHRPPRRHKRSKCTNRGQQQHTFYPIPQQQMDSEMYTMSPSSLNSNSPINCV